MMHGLKRFIYSVMGVTLFVILPGFIIISIYMENNLPGKAYIVTEVSGPAFVQYQVSHTLSTDRGETAEYQNKSEWIRIQSGDKIGQGALIKVDESGYVDVMKRKEVALRIRENTQVRLNLIPATKRVEALLDYGKILCRISGNDDTPNEKKTEKFRVKTPGAITLVSGTSFVVHYEKDRNITDVSVLEGQVSVKSESIPQLDFAVSKDQRLNIDPSRKIPLLSDLAPDIMKELQIARDLQLKLSFSERWDDILNLAMNSPLYHWAVSEITRYEMKVFLRAIQYFGVLRWQNDVPDSLRSVELEDGDYIDPWGKEYFYEKLGRGKSILISAGPDKMLHTTDDVVMIVMLKN